MGSKSTFSKSESSRRKPSHPTTTIRQSQFIPAPPEELYDAYLNERTHSLFTGASTICERFVGGKFSAWNGYITGKNVRLENGRRIVQEWQTTEWPHGYAPSLLELTFHAKGKGTEVRIIQKNVPLEQAKYYKKGWVDFYWGPMKSFFRGIAK